MEFLNRFKKKVEEDKPKPKMLRERLEQRRLNRQPSPSIARPSIKEEELEKREKAVAAVEVEMASIKQLLLRGEKKKPPDPIGGVLKSLGGNRGMPKGIAHPDALVRNQHLYLGGSKKQKARLF